MEKRDGQAYIQGVLDRDRRMLAKTITLVESSLPSDQELSRQILDALMPHTGKALRLGITGLPGAGKSTFIESFGTMLTDRGCRVAVLAVDPSSPKTGGSILADKTRMEKLSVNNRAFIRPSPSGKTLGGVARKTRETMLVCEAAGFDAVMVETVGVGQSEVAVASMVDFFLVLMIAGGGDELQGLKKGFWSWPTQWRSTRRTGTMSSAPSWRAASTKRRFTCLRRLTQTGRRPSSRAVRSQWRGWRIF